MKNIQGPSNIYECAQVIGRGTYGKVYLCTNQNSQERYAIKELNMNKEELLQLLPNYTRQINILKTLKHKHIVTFIEEFEQGNKVYIVTEFCEEGDLSKYLKGRTLSKEEVLRITAEILEGLFYIHSQGYMHRDLKPQNIFLGQGRTVKIGDYGMGKKVQVGIKNTSQVGTPLYASPDVLQGRGEYTAKCDIFSTGLIIYYMLFKSPLFIKAYDKESLKNFQYTYLSPENKTKFLNELKCDYIFKELLGQMLTLQEAKRPTVFEVIEWFSQKSGIPYHNPITQLFDKTEDQLAESALLYFKSVLGEMEQPRSKYLRLAQIINEPKKYRLESLDRYVLLYILIGMFILESNSLIGKFKDDYFRIGDRLINWKSDSAREYLVLRNHFLEVSTQYYMDFGQTFLKLSQTIYKINLNSLVKWCRDIFMSAISFIQHKKMQEISFYKKQIENYISNNLNGDTSQELKTELKSILLMS